MMINPYSKVRPTRFKGLGYLPAVRGSGPRFVDILDHKNPAIIGREYASLAELLGDVQRFAEERGLDK